ncbi:hypothetical protein UFOVP595_42 [uncultured Caudovirales phage]|uniref:Uncharacterized protein n=1 Tax=uncultured Caudovirales phage TaxID=2100421 RepID=A0A6J5N423_9CAUD|nr:hypothetical protein UFOVP595_42 [uncultured Caudovirales phage]
MSYAIEQNNLSPINYSAVRQLIESQPISLALIGKTEGNDLVNALLIRLVEGLCSSYNVAKNMDINQIQECANLLYQNYYHYSVNHFTTAFNRFKMNKYPDIKIYDRFDLSIVFAIVEKFDLELKEMRTKIEQEKLQAQQKEWSDNSVPMPDNVRIELDKLKQKFTKKSFVSNAPEPKEWSQTKQWFEDFNMIWKESGETRAGIKYIRINGLVMDRQGYLVHRLIESE